MVDVVDQAVVVAVGHRARRGGAGLAAGVLVLVVLDERDVGVDAVEVGLTVVGADGGHPLVDQVDPQALVEEGVLLEPGADRLVVVLDRLEDLGVGPVGDGGAGAVGLLHHLQRPDGHAVVEGHPEGVALLAHADVEPGGQRVDHRGADAVQATGHLVAAAAELAAGVQLGEHELDGADALGRVHVGGDAAPVVLDADRAVLHQGDVDGVGVAGEGLVDRVVDDLPDEVVQAALAGGADVHAGALADRLEPLEHRDRAGVVGRPSPSRTTTSATGSSTGSRVWSGVRSGCWSATGLLRRLGPAGATGGTHGARPRATNALGVISGSSLPVKDDSRHAPGRPVGAPFPRNSDPDSTPVTRPAPSGPLNGLPRRDARRLDGCDQEGCACPVWRPRARYGVRTRGITP